ncbi:hypothetical protein [Parafrankia sp. EUN1f]|uniref:hypothetical protein n=1 Tax=Parafrankia sp. EUN1f TaxID=102897 RepID=UPI0018DCFDD5|nr:hypothetical protein [Parafrankia sp. EUN1f]
MAPLIIGADGPENVTAYCMVLTDTPPLGYIHPKPDKPAAGPVVSAGVSGKPATRPANAEVSGGSAASVGASGKPATTPGKPTKPAKPATTPGKPTKPAKPATTPGKPTKPAKPATTPGKPTKPAKPAAASGKPKDSGDLPVSAGMSE